MSALSGLKDQFDRAFSPYFKTIKAKILGSNNERLDFIMDSFYKLNPNQRNGFLGILVLVVTLFVLGALGLYHIQVLALQNELSDTLAALG